MQVSYAVREDSRRDEAKFQEQSRLAQLYHQGRLQEMQEEHSKEVEHIQIFNKKQEAELRKAFEVQISSMAKNMEEKLRKQEAAFIARFDSQNKLHDSAFEKLEDREESRSENYKKQQDERIAKMHEQYQNARDLMSQNKPR